MNALLLVELVTIAGLCTTTVGAVQIRRIEGQVALVVGVGLLVVGVTCQAMIARIAP